MNGSAQGGRMAGGALLLFLFLFVCGCGPTAKGTAEGERRAAPAFELVRLDGVPVSLADQRGRTLILDFWATWCAPCEVQMPVLDAIWKARGGEGLMVLGLSMDTDPPERVSAWLKERSVEYPVAMADQQLAIDYGAWAFPTLVIVDPAGDIYYLDPGVTSRPEIEALLDAIDREFGPAPWRPARA